MFAPSEDFSDEEWELLESHAYARGIDIEQAIRRAYLGWNGRPDKR